MSILDRSPEDDGILAEHTSAAATRERKAILARLAEIEAKAKLPKESLTSQLGGCLQEALTIVRGARNKDYGDPAEDYARTAALWSAYLGVPITARQAAMCMCLVKVSRLANSPAHKDSMVDLAGYAAVYERCSDVAESKKSSSS